jgi:two-component system nitrate/nitrite response regulator NarL
MRFSVSIVSSNPIACEGLSRIMESEGAQVMSSSSSVEELVFIDATVPDLVIIDLPSGEEQVEALENLSHGKAVVLAESFDRRTMVECFARGAHGYLIKDISCEALMASLDLAFLGEKLFPTNLADAILQDLLSDSVVADHQSASGDAQLSQREHQVLNCLMEGDSNKAIARKLEVTEPTIKVHVKAILRKLKLENRTQAALWGQSQGLGTQAMESLD